MHHEAKPLRGSSSEAEPVRRDGLAAVAVILLTIGLIVLVVTSLV